MNAQDNFISKHFAWFTGVVEDIFDPMQMGRVRVRCFGYHTADKAQIPTEDLPWALVMMPVTSASMSGIGQSATGILQGSWVIGFFRDGPSAQDPIVLGTIPALTPSGDSEKGFSDPAGKHPINPDENDMPREARAEYEQSSAYVTRKGLRVTRVEKAVPPKVSSVAVDEPDSYYLRSDWSTLDITQTTKPDYTFNNAIHTQGGHVKEIDDTNESKRMLDQHSSGTYVEVVNSGDRTVYVVGNNYTVVLGSDNIYINGSCNLTVAGDFRHLVKGNYHLEVEGNKTEYIKGSRQSKIGQSEQTEIGKDLATNVTSNLIFRAGANATITIDGSKAQTIGGNCDLTVAGDNGLVVVGKHQEFSAGHHETSSAGHLYLSSKENLELETLAASAIKADGSQTITIGGTQNMTISGDQTIQASTTNIQNNVNVSGTLAATTQVRAGTPAVNLTTHTHGTPPSTPPPTKPS